MALLPPSSSNVLLKDGNMISAVLSSLQVKRKPSKAMLLAMCKDISFNLFFSFFTNKTSNLSTGTRDTPSNSETTNGTNRTNDSTPTPPGMRNGSVTTNHRRTMTLADTADVNSRGQVSNILIGLKKDLFGLV